MLLSTNSWMLVQGTFTAVGGESYLTLGNFRTDANTTYPYFPPAVWLTTLIIFSTTCR